MTVESRINASRFGSRRPNDEPGRGAAPGRWIIVDPDPALPRDLAALGRQGVSLCFHGSARAALTDRSAEGSAWLINVFLPDMPGRDLFRVLRDRLPDAFVGLIADAYDIEDELWARTCRASCYLCKPLSAEFFLPAAAPLASFDVRATAVRAGPGPPVLFDS